MTTEQPTQDSENRSGSPMLIKI